MVRHGPVNKCSLAFPEVFYFLFNEMFCKGKLSPFTLSFSPPVHFPDPLALALEMMASLGGDGIGRKRRFHLQILLPRGIPHVYGGKELRESPWKVSGLALPALRSAELSL